MGERLKTVLVNLSQLSAAELEELEGRVKALRSLAGPSVKEQSFAWTLCDLIAEEMQSLGHVRTPTKALMRYSGEKSFRQNAALLDEWLVKVGIPQRMRRPFLSLCILLLYRNLKSFMDVPVTAHVLMNNIAHIPPVINKSFPGYADAGLLGLIVRQEKRGIRDVWNKQNSRPKTVLREQG